MHGLDERIAAADTPNIGVTIGIYLCLCSNSALFLAFPSSSQYKHSLQYCKFVSTLKLVDCAQESLRRLIDAMLYTHSERSADGRLRPQSVASQFAVIFRVV